LRLNTEDDDGRWISGGDGSEKRGEKVDDNTNISPPA